MPGRILQWQYAAAKLRDQARQPALARRPGGIGLETGPLSTQLQARRKMAADPGQGCASYRRGTQKSDRGCGTLVGSRSVENKNWQAHFKKSWINKPNK